MESSYGRGSPRYRRCLALLVAVVTIGLIGGPARAGDVDNETCAACHEEIVAAFAKTAHGIYYQARPALRDYGCEACHGSGTRHIEEGTVESIINPANSRQFDDPILCLDCHRDAQFQDWEFSSHHTEDMNCTDCHDAHAEYGGALKQPVPDLCYSCHAEVLAATRMPSHHPIAEGKVSCNDCHNPHGAEAMLTRDIDNRELCLSCHPQYEGPFVYEHAPVNEDCMICHQPHGSVADNLLIYQEPTLCLNCHDMHFHATVVGFEGVSQDRLGRDYESEEDSWKRGMLTKCSQCHSAVHGTDNPSQATSSGGNGLTR